MKRTLLFASALALAGAAAAQAAAPQPVNPTPPPASDANASAPLFRAGMTVKDATGGTIGRITRINRSPNGLVTVALSVDGKVVTVPASTLTLSPTGAIAVSSMTKAQIKAGAPG